MMSARFIDSPQRGSRAQPFQLKHRPVSPRLIPSAMTKTPAPQQSLRSRQSELAPRPLQRQGQPAAARLMMMMHQCLRAS